MDAILENFSPDTVFSLAFLLAVIGVGTWFSRQFWPWYAKQKSDEQKTTRLLATEIAGLRTELVLLLTDLKELLIVLRGG